MLMDQNKQLQAEVNQLKKDTYEYTFYYFKEVMVRAEPIRMLLAHANVKFIDKRFSFSEWPALKPGMPNQQVPCLEFKDGKRVGQSNAILRMLGKKHGYYPTDPMQVFKCEELIDLYLDVVGVIYKPYFEKDESEKQTMCDNVFDNVLPKFLNHVEPLLSKGGAYLLGDNLTTADFWIGGLYTNFIANPDIGFAEERWQAVTDSYPNFKAYGERFAKANHDWISTRPSNPL